MNTASTGNLGDDLGQKPTNIKFACTINAQFNMI